jgi:hypothetical protein
MTHSGQKRPAVGAAVVVLTLLVVGCAAPGPSPEQQAAIEGAVSGYLDALARSYSTLDLSHLDGHASPLEISNVRRLLQQLANSGDRLEATLVGIEFTSLDIFREVNASVALVEVWDLIRYDPLTGREKGRTDGSVQSTLIQLRLIDGQWLVIGRHIVDRETGGDLDDGGVEG